jgi:hypothetical protein
MHVLMVSVWALTHAQEIEAKLRAPAGGSSSSAAAAAPAPASQLPLSPSQWLDGQYHRGHTPDPMSWACDAEAAADPSLADAAIVGRLLDAENNFSEWTLVRNTSWGGSSVAVLRLTLVTS